ncbi:hypothetical protein GN244_ATG17950 [Phytophthora infestans]|uniref:Uncharacterized protein n=1 Tax=Phytophthora infestans TaxID=4787 RepID=A0A833SGH6_PHYIN|nr:hypothetical protein GN244_ATG17950 [Phytophthora infestans]
MSLNFRNDFAVLKIKDYICMEDDKIGALMPGCRGKNQLQLNDFVSASLKQQSADGASLLDVRNLLSARIE